MRAARLAGSAEAGDYFPSFSEGLSLRALCNHPRAAALPNFPSFSEGLSLRALGLFPWAYAPSIFPFLFGGTFIEGSRLQKLIRGALSGFPFLFGGTFIEGTATHTAGLT